MAKPPIILTGYRGDGICNSAIANKGHCISPASVNDPAVVTGERLSSNNGIPIMVDPASNIELLLDSNDDTPNTPYRDGPPYVAEVDLDIIGFDKKEAAAQLDLNEAASLLRSAFTLFGYDKFIGADSSLIRECGRVSEGRFELNPAGKFSNSHFCRVGYVDFHNSNYSVAADFGNADNNGGALALLYTFFTTYDKFHFAIAALSAASDFPRKVIGNVEYQGNLRDAHVLDGRIFALFDLAAVDPAVPPESRHIKSELREYKVTLKNKALAFEMVDKLEIGKNAVHLAYHRHNGDGYLFVPCIGGDQNKDINNGADSSLSIVKILPNGGFDHSASFEDSGEMRALVGVNGSTGCHDFRSVAIASNGMLYFLCGGFNSNNGFNYRVYKTTAAHLLSNAITGNTSQSPAVPFTLLTDSDLSSSPYIQRQTATSAHFWALGIVLGPDGHEYLLFARGGKNNPSDPVGHDVISLVRVGQPWLNHNTIGLHDDGTEINEFTGLADAHGFTLTFLNISVPGRDLPVPMIAAPPPTFAKKSGDAADPRDAEQDVKVENAKREAETLKK